MTRLVAFLLAAAVVGGCTRGPSGPAPSAPEPWRPSDAQMMSLDRGADRVFGQPVSPGNGLSDVADAALAADALVRQRIDDLFAAATADASAVGRDTELPLAVEIPLRHSALKRGTDYELEALVGGRQRIVTGGTWFSLEQLRAVARAGYLTALTRLDAGQRSSGELLLQAVGRLGHRLLGRWEHRRLSSLAVEIARLGAEGLLRLYQADGRYQRQLAVEDYLKQLDRLDAQLKSAPAETR